MGAASCINQFNFCSYSFDGSGNARAALSSILPRPVALPKPGNDIAPVLSSCLEGARIFIAGHNGFVGSALERRLIRERCEVLTVKKEHLDLRRQFQTENWMCANRPDIVIVAAATGGDKDGYSARPADVLSGNLAISQNLIEASWKAGVRKLVYLGTGCVYPSFSGHPMAEAAMLPVPLDPAEEAYAIAKISGLKLVQAMRRQNGCDFISILPASLYGPCRRPDMARERSLPELVGLLISARDAKAKECVVAGGGHTRKEFMHVDDCAEGIIHALRFYSGDEPVNLGSGEAVSMATLAKLIAGIIGYDGRIIFNSAGHEIVHGKVLDCSRIHALGWLPRTNLRDGLQEACQW